MNGDLLVVQLLRHHQHAALRVQVEELGAVWVEAAVDGVNQLAVVVAIFSADLQDVLPWGGILRNPHLKPTENIWRLITVTDKQLRERGLPTHFTVGLHNQLLSSESREA